MNQIIPINTYGMRGRDHPREPDPNYLTTEKGNPAMMRMVSPNVGTGHERGTSNYLANENIFMMPANQFTAGSWPARMFRKQNERSHDDRIETTVPPSKETLEPISPERMAKLVDKSINQIDGIDASEKSIGADYDGDSMLPAFIQSLLGRKALIQDKRSKKMGKKKNDTNFDLEDLMDMMGRRSLRRTFYRNMDNITGIAMGVASDTFHEFAENNLYTTLTIFGHYDTFISKSSVKVLLRYLWPKYGKHILMDVDSNFSMCSISIEKIKKSVLGFPELVNKTIRPGIYFVKVSNVGRGTWMIVLKNKMYNEGDISENGIRSEAKNFKTTIIFVGERKIGWKKRIQKEIDTYCSNLVTNSASSDKIRVQSMGGGDNSQNDIIIRPMNNLMFPQKEGLLERIQSFLDSGKIYKDNGIPYRKGFLLVGPRGTGKTSFAFSMAEYFHMECVSVDLSYFDTNGGANAFNGTNTVYIIDEIDAQLPKSRVAETHEAITVEQQKIIDRLHKLLKAMDDMGDGCIIIGTTNFPERLDPAIVRSGRFDEQILFDNLDKKFAVMMCKNRGLDPDEILAKETFPINPAYLEQKLIDALLVKNNIQKKTLKSADEIVSEEYGVDISELEQKSQEEDAEKKEMDEAIERRRQDLLYFAGTTDDSDPVSPQELFEYTIDLVSMDKDFPKEDATKIANSQLDEFTTMVCQAVPGVDHDEVLLGNESHQYTAEDLDDGEVEIPIKVAARLAYEFSGVILKPWYDAGCVPLSEEESSEEDESEYHRRETIKGHEEALRDMFSINDDKDGKVSPAGVFDYIMDYGDEAEENGYDDFVDIALDLKKDFARMIARVVPDLEFSDVVSTDPLDDSLILSVDAVIPVSTAAEIVYEFIDMTMDKCEEAKETETEEDKKPEETEQDEADDEEDEMIPSGKKEDAEPNFEVVASDVPGEHMAEDTDED